ncbi:UNVERIFIED_CONTAM: hypothetical protein FKN15_003880 [Acipenser sinensis]
MPVRMIAPYTSLLPRPTQQSPRSSTLYSQPPIISRIAIPPGSPQGEQHRPIPLSVIMRLQHPYWARENAIASWGQAGDTATFWNTQQPQPQFERPAAGMKVVTPEGLPALLDSGAVEPELEGLGVGVGEMMEVAPRPLSPTRLQPVLPPDAEPLPQMEELLRMRAEIPRALKKRSSIDNPPAQRKQYQQIISKLLQWHKGVEDLGSDAVWMIAPYTALLPHPTLQSPRSSTGYSQPPIISRIAIPPGSPQGEQHRPIPLSVIMRLQHPYWARENAIASWGQAGDTATFWNTQQPQPQFERPAAGMKVVTPEGLPALLDSGAVEPELEGLGVGVGEMMEVAPRPLSPTRLQPVLPPDAEPLPQMEELLRIRAEIPRALKKRSSIDNPVPFNPPAQAIPTDHQQAVAVAQRR